MHMITVSGVTLAEHLDRENAHVRDVYAHYGLAMYLAQCLEHGLVLALVYAKLLPTEVPSVRSSGRAFSVTEFEKRFELFTDEQFSETMGVLIKRLGKASALSSELETQLVQAKHRRNDLAHNYFRDRDEALVSFVGRNGMIAELKEAQQLFMSLEDQVNAAVATMAEGLGQDLSKREEGVQFYMAQVIARAAALDAETEDDNR
jgi:hypothetical protein